MSTVKRIESARPEQRRVIKTAGSDSVERMLDEWRRERPELNASPLGIQGRVVRLSGHLLRRVDEWLGPLGLSWEAFSLIVTLRRSGKPYKMRPTDILRESLLTSGAITNRIDRVAEMGLVKRYPDPDDRRVTSSSSRRRARGWRTRPSPGTSRAWRARSTCFRLPSRTDWLNCFQSFWPRL